MHSYYLHYLEMHSFFPLLQIAVLKYNGLYAKIAIRVAKVTMVIHSIYIKKSSPHRDQDFHISAWVVGVLYSGASLIVSPLKAYYPYYLSYCILQKCIVVLEMTSGLPLEKKVKKVQLTPKGLRVFFLKIASNQPLLKASQIVQN